MDLYKEMLLHALMKREGMNQQPDAVVEGICYRAIQGICRILDEDTLSDFDCIEKIVALLDNAGIDAGSRHDFG